VAVVGDDSLFTPLSYLPLDWQLERFDNVTALMAALRSDTEVDGVILGDRFAGASLDDVLKHVAALLLNGIPCALVAYSEGTVQEVQAAWGGMELAMRDTYRRAVQARIDAGELVTEEELISPSDTTQFVIAGAGGGAQHLIRVFGPRLITPFEPESLNVLDDPRYANPFPTPSDSGMLADNASFGEKKARIVTVVSDKGGCGKTSLSLMLAATLAHASNEAGNPLRTVVIDLDRQSQISAMFPAAEGSIMDLKPSSTPEQIASAIHYPLPQIPNLGIIVGAPTSGDHRAMRTVELYSHVINIVSQDLADLVIIDGSVGVTDDPLTMWAQRNSYVVYYVLDQLTNSLRLAADAYEDTIRAEDLGGVGLEPERFVLVENMLLDESINPKARQEFLAGLNRRLPGVPVHGHIPHGGIQVHAAQQETPEGGLLRLAVNSGTLAAPLREWAQKLYPDLLYSAKVAPASTKKRGLLR
jgi:cellulose biosynthesis protein BcsQ